MFGSGDIGGWEYPNNLVRDSQFFYLVGSAQRWFGIDIIGLVQRLKSEWDVVVTFSTAKLQNQL
jgi:hypothetical protein